MANNNIYCKLLSVALLSASMCGCMHEEIDRSIPGGGSEQENRVTFRIEVTGTGLPSSRAMSEAQVYEIGDMDVLLFKIDGTNETFFAHKSVTLDAGNIKVTGTGESAVYNLEFSTVLPSVQNARVVLVTNARAEVESALTGVTESTSKKTILESLEVLRETPWPTNGQGTVGTEGGYKPIPMYGECGTAKEVKGGATIDGIKLIRMLAAIDVTNTAPNFQLTGVYLVNPNSKGRVSPVMDADNKTSDAPATTPHLPVNPLRKSEEWPFVGSLSVSAQSLLGEIYAFEADAASDVSQTAHDHSVCLILKGKYNNGAETYYRVDFVYDDQGSDAADHTKYMPLLRNYRYVVSVNSAEGDGYASIEEAKTTYTASSNLKTNIIHYDLGEVKNVQFDNGHMLAVSETSLGFSRNEGEYILKVATTRPEGWNATVSSENDWLNITPATGAVGAVRDLKLTYGENTGSGNRTGTVTITAGTFTRKVSVEQNNIMPTLSFKVTDISGNELTETSGLTFPYTTGRGSIPAQKMVLSWSPVEAEITADLIYDGGFVYGSDNPESFTTNGSVREHVFEIMPDGSISGTGRNGDIRYYPDYYRIIEFTAEFNGSTISKRVRLEQIACGYNGNALPMMIGNREYLTHRYGNRCWMVENSKEGNPSQTAYAASVISSSIYPNPASNGYWYHWGKAASACPDGWHLPSSFEFAEMNEIIHEGVKWWYGSQGAANNAFAGYMNYVGNTGNINNAFGQNGSQSYWWSADEYEYGAHGSSSAFTPEMKLDGRLVSVRCVRNEPNVSYLNVDGVVPYYARNNTGETTYKFSIKSNVAWSISQSGSNAGSVSPTSGGGAGTDTNIEITYTVPEGTDENVKIKTLALTINDVNPDAGKRAANIDLQLNTVDCGTHGRAFRRTIGSNDYQTHMYGNKCWMVDNLKGGSSAAGYSFGGGKSGNSGAIYEVITTIETNVPGTGEYEGYSIRKVTDEWKKKDPVPQIGAFEGDYYEETGAATACPSGWVLPDGHAVTSMEAEANSLRMVPESSAAFWFKDVEIGGNGTINHISDYPNRLSEPRMSQGYGELAQVIFNDPGTESNKDSGSTPPTITLNIITGANELWSTHDVLWPYSVHKNAYYWLDATAASGRLYFYVDFNNNNNIVRNYGGYVKDRAMCIRCVKDVSN